MYLGCTNVPLWICWDGYNTGYSRGKRESWQTGTVLSLSAYTVIFLRKHMFSVTLLKTHLINLNKSSTSRFTKVSFHDFTDLCHGPAGVPRLATRCLCVLSTWLVVCLVPCAPMSIVCPLPSCYLIIVSVAPAVSPSLPSFVSLYSLLVSAVLCWSVVFHVSSSREFHVDCAPVFCLPACFSPSGWFLLFICFIYY